ncbi:CHASE2 domain-containing protein [Chamaesiphon polymorphus]|uniref:Chase2 sensor protein n=1 Tax=Chamaesiphon polymorphus CCALA 037 TaxID=2107692 RepID=A0A2T1GDX6_9CYAN|nr:CHASE2 domain-containing protein [Chamaesiphon polymorphus]PSB55721.1 Chase2 sensor protein [Chamaesiphon polymorphus CCALA 037]
MERLLVLNLGNGNTQTGLPSIIAQLWDEATAQPMQMAGSLPAMPELARSMQQWQTLYFALYAHLGWRRIDTRSFEFDIDEADVTHISQAEFESVCQQLQICLNQWLNADGFQQIQRRIRTHLSPDDRIRIAIAAQDSSVLQLPWQLWQLLEDYPTAEIALSPAEYARSQPVGSQVKPERVSILAILGNSQGIDVEYDRQILSQLPHANIHWLVEPSSEQLQAQLWDGKWDMLFFAGHSSSQERGCMQINSTETLTIDRLKYGLKRAISNGLKLAIFNSCDGLGLAWDLADLRIPQTIVMRQPVPDRVAQAFLTTFLQTFAAGRSLYAAVREAREKLELLERDFPCATWLPVICQNPAEPAAVWADWYQAQSQTVALPPPIRSGSVPTQRTWWQSVWQSALSIAACSAIGTGLTLGAKTLGWLQPLELAAYDRLMQSRPIEPADPRLLIVTLTDDDVRAQRRQTASGSISDESLAKLLQILDRAQPSAIGLDIYRDFKTELPALKSQLANNDRLITICKRPDPRDDTVGVSPAPEVPPTAVGFSDFVQDYDGAVRRQLVAMNPTSTSQCQAGNALSTLLAMRYLADRQLPIEFSQQNVLRLGKLQIAPLAENAGGYYAQDAQGLQVMLNYRRTAQGIAQTVTLEQALSGELPVAAIKDRIILIGSVNPSSNDFWPTPFGSGFAQQQPGVFVHAQMVSQMLGAVANERPLLYPVTLPQAIAISIVTAIGGGAIACVRNRYYRWLLLGGAAIAIYGVAGLGLTGGVWLPVGMQLLSLTGTWLLVSGSRSAIVPLPIWSQKNSRIDN